MNRNKLYVIAARQRRYRRRDVGVILAMALAVLILLTAVARLPLTGQSPRHAEMVAPAGSADSVAAGDERAAPTLEASDRVAARD